MTIAPMIRRLRPELDARQREFDAYIKPEIVSNGRADNFMDLVGQVLA